MSKGTYCQVVVGVFVAVLAVGFAPAVAETVSANFTAGNTTAEVDGYLGMADDGWATAWVQKTNSGTTTAATVLTPPSEGTELKAGLGRYLDVTVNREGTGVGTGGGVARSYKTVGMEPIDWTENHIIRFTMRIDEDVDAEGAFTDLDDRYQFYDRPTVLVPSGNVSAFIISGASKNTSGTIFPANVAGEWTFYDGLGPDGNDGWVVAQNVDTNIALHTNHVYDFTIVMKPETQSYDATVKDVTAGLSFTAYDLGWRTLATEAPGYLHFVGRDGASTTSDARHFSLDAIVIDVPEPSALLLLLAAATTVVATCRRPRA